MCKAACRVKGDGQTLKLNTGNLLFFLQYVLFPSFMMVSTIQQKNLIQICVKMTGDSIADYLQRQQETQSKLFYPFTPKSLSRHAIKSLFY